MFVAVKNRKKTFFSPAQEMFKKAREAGASENDPKSTSTFGGIFNALTGQSNAAAVNEEREAEPITVTLTFWENGFSVDEVGLGG